MTDRIELTGIEAHACHGVLAEEKTSPQPFIADIVLEADLTRAGRGDDLAWTINYAQVCEHAYRVLTGPPVDLIETLAQRIADGALAFPLVEAVEVTVHKPQAPAGVPFHDPALGGPAVHIRREQDRQAVVACGANLGDRVATLTSAACELAATDGIRVLAAAPLVETDPVGGPDQPDYLNSVLLLRTRRSPWSLLDELHRIERWHHRVREVRWGARTLDLDLIQFGSPADGTEVLLGTDELTLPHPRAGVRGFVLGPWHQVDPSAATTWEGRVQTVSALLDQVGLEGVRPGPSWGEWR